ncbi:MAG: FtsX-like permease family protein [Pseudomonadota bacterium]
MASPLRFAWRRLGRQLHSGENIVLMLALAIAVAATSAVGLFSDRVRGAILQSSGDAMGADLLVTGRSAIPQDFIKAVQATGAQVSLAVNLPSVVFAGSASTLAAVKAVQDNYPLRGALRISAEPFGAEQGVTGIPPRGEAWADLRLWTELNLARGAVLEVGGAKLKVAALLTYEPDRGAGFTDLAPRLLINAEDLASTRLVQPGSRTEYRLMLAGSTESIGQISQLPLPKGLRRLGPDEARGEIRSALNRAQRFLDLAVLAATLLAGAAVALSAQRHGARLRDEAALLKCLGARQGFISGSLICGLLLLGLIGCSAGGVLGFAAQGALAHLLASLMHTTLPPPSLLPVLAAFALGLIMLLGFALPPVLQAGRAPPLRVFQRDETAMPRTRVALVCAVLTGAALLGWQTGDVNLSVTVLGGAAAALLLLALLAALLVRMLAPLRRGTAAAWRLGLGNLARRRGGTIAQSAALGLCLLALLLLGISRNDLLEAWRGKLSPTTPNVFLVGIQPAQLAPLRTFFVRHQLPVTPPWPMVRARLTALNDTPVTVDSFDDPETQRWINREFNLSWTEDLGDDNRLIEGSWWGKAGRGQPWLSVDDYAVKRLNLKLGDRMKLQVADAELELTVKSVREIHWDSFRPNFFLVTPPGVLDKAPASWLSSFYLPKDQRALLRELIREFPNVTALDLDAILSQVRTIIERIVTAVEFILLFALAAGLAVLLAGIENTRDERVREIGLLRALGARRAVVMQALAAEFAALGFLAGAVATLAAQAITWALAREVFEIPYTANAALWIIGPVSGVILVAGFGWISLRSALNTPPRQVLA